MVGRYKIAARVAYDWHIEFLEGFNDVFAEASLIRQRIAGVIYAAIDAAAHMPGAWLVSREEAPAYAHTQRHWKGVYAELTR
jgi:hypothetical protein